MLYRIIENYFNTNYNVKYKNDSEKVDTIKNQVEKAGLKLIQITNIYGLVELFVEINTIEELNRLVEQFGCHIVYGDKLKDYYVIEIYSTYRE